MTSGWIMDKKSMASESCCRQHNRHFLLFFTIFSALFSFYSQNKCNFMQRMYILYTISAKMKKFVYTISYRILTIFLMEYFNWVIYLCRHSMCWFWSERRAKQCLRKKKLLSDTNINTYLPQTRTLAIAKCLEQLKLYKKFCRRISELSEYVCCKSSRHI